MLQLFSTDSARLDKPFAGINVLVFGELYQVQPVNCHWIFEQYHVSEPFLWPYFRFVELITNVRQENDRRMLDLCNHIQIGEVTPEVLNILKSRHLDTLHATQLNDAMRIVPTNALTDHHNAARLETFRETRRSMIRDLGPTEHPIYKVTAVDAFEP